MSFWSNCVLFGAVVGSVIGFLWNSVHSPENELLQQLFAFRGCGRICHWLLVEFRPQPRKEAFGAIVCFSGLWWDLSSTCPIDWLLLEFRPQPRKQAFGAILCFSGLWQDLTSTFCIHWLLLEFHPQPRKRAFEAILCFAGLWLDLTSTFFIHWLLFEFRPQPRQRAFGAILCFSGCGKIWQARFVLIAMTADRTRSRTRTGPDPTRTRAPDPTRTGRTLTMTVATFRRFFLNFQTQRPQWWKLTIQLLSGGGRVKQLDTLRVGHLQWITEHNGDYSPNSYCSRNSYSNWEMLINHHILGTCYFQTNPYTYNMVSQVQVGL